MAASTSTVRQGEVWWADLPEPRGSAAGLRRPVVVVQGDRFNRSRIATALCVPLTSQLKWAEAPGNVLLSARATGLSKDSVANVSLLLALSKSHLTECTGQLSELELQQLFVGIDLVLGRA
jgi:mRNA interferase MazF